MMKKQLLKLFCALFSWLLYFGNVQAQAPVFTSTPITNGTENVTYTYALSATDPNNNPLTYSATTLPSWLSLTAGQNSTTDFGGTISSPGSQNFNVTIADPNPPTVTAYSPANNATGVANNSNLTLTFNETVQLGTGNIYLKKTADNSIVEQMDVTSSKVSINNNVVTVDPGTDFPSLTNLYINVDATAFKDLSNNAYAGITNSTTWAFQSLIQKTTPAITFASTAIKTLGDADFTPGATSTNTNTAITYASDNAAVAAIVNGNIHIVGTGTANIIASQAADATYNAAADVVQVLTVGAATQTINFTLLATATYGDANLTLNATASSNLPVTFSSADVTIATVSGNILHILKAGSVTITASQAGNNSYLSASAAQTLVINKASLNITTIDQISTFGTAIPALTVTYSGFLNGDTQTSLITQPTVSTTATRTSPVGTYPIIASGAAAANYNFNYTGGTLRIFPGIQTITFITLTKYYGDADFALTATASSGLPVTYSSSNTSIATVDSTGLVHIVGAGTVLITALQQGNGNYVATTAINQQIVINKATLTATADNLNKLYGAANPPLTVTYNGFINGDGYASLTTQPVLSTTATMTSEVGIYPVSIGGAASSKYYINYQFGKLTVDSGSQVIIINQPPAKIYGDADFALAASTTSGLPVTYGSSNPAVATVDASGMVHIVAAGNTTITVSQTGSSNFSAATSVTQLLTVNKAPLIIAATNQTKTYGAVNPALTVTYIGFVNGESAAVLTTQPTIATTATTASVVGITYPVTASGAAADNYDITYTNGILTINPAALTVTADDKTRVFGIANPALTITYTGFVSGDSSASLTTAPTVNTTATTTSIPGTYPIGVSGVAAANYTITYTGGTLTVTNAPVSGISLAQSIILENQPAGTAAGTISATSSNPNASFTYTLVSGAGATDNASFSIQGNKLLTAKSFDYEQQATYSVLIRATNQYGLYLDQVFSINITDVNEVPTLAAIAMQQSCYNQNTQTLKLSGITAGPETAQTVSLKVSSTNPALFKTMSVTIVSGGTANLSYQLATIGTATVTLTVQDNGGTANGGVDNFSQTFTISSNDLPTAMVTSDKGTQILKGETLTLTASTSGGTTYSWNTMPNVSGSSSSAVIQVRPFENTTYTVTATNASGCSTISSITIKVSDNYQDIHPANLLTPNGDGKNDIWIVKNIDLYPNNTVLIYDKGGRKLIEMKHYNNSWDGTFNGTPLAEGTYYYVIDFGSGIAPFKGFITILRNR